jgi:hypothetical protein
MAKQMNCTEFEKRKEECASKCPVSTRERKSATANVYITIGSAWRMGKWRKSLGAIRKIHSCIENHLTSRNHKCDCRQFSEFP